jgi:hypothetical protein
MHDRTISLGQNERVCALGLGIVNQVPAVQIESSLLSALSSGSLDFLR